MIGTAIGGPMGGVMGGAAGGTATGNPLGGAISGAGSALGANFLGPLLGKGLGQVLPQLSDEALQTAVFAGESGVGASFPIPDLVEALGPAQSTGLFGVPSGTLGKFGGGILGAGAASPFAMALGEGGGPPVPGPPKLGPMGPAPVRSAPNLEQFVVKTGGGLPNSLEELLRRR